VYLSEEQFALEASEHKPFSPRFNLILKKKKLNIIIET